MLPVFLPSNRPWSEDIDSTTATNINSQRSMYLGIALLLFCLTNLDAISQNSGIFDAGTSISKATNSSIRNGVVYQSVGLAVHHNDTVSTVNNFTFDVNNDDKNAANQSEEQRPRIRLQPGDNRPTGLRLAFMGDSVMRYQYLSLAYFLRHNEWFDPDVRVNNIVGQKSFPGGLNREWEPFLAGSNEMLKPLETCDCFRAAGEPDWEGIYENRYFYDASHDNLVVFFVAWGSLAPLHGRINVSDALNGMADYVFNHNDTVVEEWVVREWEDLVRNIVPQFDVSLRPTHFVLNYGLHPANFTEEAKESLSRAFRDVNVTSIWRTTSHDRTRQRPASADFEDASMCHHLDHCLNISWWKDLREELYQDTLHPSEPAYRGINEGLLELIGYEFPQNYSKMNRTDWMQPIDHDFEVEQEVATVSSDNTLGSSTAVSFLEMNQIKQKENPVEGEMATAVGSDKDQVDSIKPLSWRRAKPSMLKTKSSS